MPRSSAFARAIASAVSATSTPKTDQSQGGEVKSVLAGPAARIEHRSGESAFGCQSHYCWLRLANIPRRRAVVVRRIPGQSRQPFVTGWLPTAERIVAEGY
jgi:hypothetical protein